MKALSVKVQEAFFSNVGADYEAIIQSAFEYICELCADKDISFDFRDAKKVIKEAINKFPILKTGIKRGTIVTIELPTITYVLTPHFITNSNSWNIYGDGWTVKENDFKCVYWWIVDLIMELINRFYEHSYKDCKVTVSMRSK